MRVKASTAVAAAVVAAFVIAPLLGSSSAAASVAVTAARLVGVWSAARSFGPPADGAAIIVRNEGGAWSAHMGFEDVRASGSQGGADFVFADGVLRVSPRAGDFTGQWIQNATVTTGYRFATPVTFAPSGQDSWVGRIHPLADTQHMYLYIQSDRAGHLSAFVRNPESNQGARIGLRRVVVDGEVIHLRKAGSRDLDGRIGAAYATLTLRFDGFPGDFVFTRGADAASPRFFDRAPVQNGDGWHTQSLRAARLDVAKISALIDVIQQRPTSPAAPFIQSLLIARHGKLVLDEYLNDFSIDRPHDVRSAGKSVTTLLLGKAMQGSALGAQSPVYLLFPQYAPFANDSLRKQAMTLADLMTMSSGYACDDNDDASPGNEDAMQSQTSQPDWYKYTLDLPMIAEPGTHAVYCSAGINLLGGIITKATGAWLPKYFYDSFAQPMQFGSYGLWLTPPPLDTAYMAGGDYFLPRDFLKFGQLILDGGRWNGTHIVDAAWLAESIKPHASLYAPGDYGYGWHLSTYSVGGRIIHAVSAGGNGGQLLFAFPELDMTVLITAANYGQYPVWQRFVTELVPKYILGSVNGP